VGDLLGVHIVQGQEHLLYNVSGLDLVKCSYLNQTIEELSTLEKFRHYIIVVLVLKKFNHLDDVWVRALLQNLQLVHHQNRQHLFSFERLFANLLDCAHCVRP
jgi:hypothetical protein